jgi:hypothetical protein
MADMPLDGATGTLTLVDGPGQRVERGAIHAFLDDEGHTRWEVLTPGQAVGFTAEDVVGFVEHPV